MNIVIFATGTRGDVQPMIALGLALRSAGHSVRIVAGSNFTTWIQSYGLEISPTTDIESLMQSELGVKWVESKSSSQQLKYMKALLHTVIDETVRQHIEGAHGGDLLLSGFVSEPFVHAVSEKTSIPQISTMLQPTRPSLHGAATMLPLLPGAASIFNRWMGLIAQRFTWDVAVESCSALRQSLGLPPINVNHWVRAVNAIPALYGISQHILPPLRESQIQVTGFWFLDEQYTPSPDLADFINAGEPPVYIGFGSMSSSNPQRILNLAAEALARNNRRGVLARGWGITEGISIPDHLFVLDKVPHSWLFPRMAAVVHHGGAGTTAAGLRAGVPSVIIPHMADQPYWGRRMHELGVGAKPIPRTTLTAQTLADGLHTVLNTPRIRENADTLGAKIRTEKGIENAVNWIQAFFRS